MLVLLAVLFLGLIFILDNLTSEREPGTMRIRVTYTDTDPQRAKDVVGTVAQVASELIPTIGGTSEDTSHITAEVWRKAQLPTTPASPHPLRNGLLAPVAGLALASAWAIVKARLRPPPTASEVS
jgi:capsular polysaccharide biosynthesis protein